MKQLFSYTPPPEFAQMSSGEKRAIVWRSYCTALRSGRGMAAIGAFIAGILGGIFVPRFIWPSANIIPLIIAFTILAAAGGIAYSILICQEMTLRLRAEIGFRMSKGSI